MILRNITVGTRNENCGLTRRLHALRCGRNHLGDSSEGVCYAVTPGDKVCYFTTPVNII